MTRTLARLGTSILVADGATGTNLQGAGLPPGGHTEEWILDYPERILALHQSFVEAGAQILLTCTFGATAVRLHDSKYSGRVAELNEKAGELARRAANVGQDVLVAGSMGPLGKLLQPLGPLAPDTAQRAYNEQAKGLVAGGVDLLVVETQFSLEEAKAAFEGIREISDIPIVVSFSYDRGARTMMGTKPAAVAALFGELGVTMIGVNCGTTLADALTVLREYRETTAELPVWVKPNAGAPRMENGRAVYDVSPNQMGEFARTAADLGARVVGGCCGTTPAHIEAISRALSNRRG